MRFLIVEDSPLDFKIISRILKKIGADNSIAHAQNLSEAKTELNNKNYDFIFMDFSLPDTIGWEGIEEIRNLAEHTPLVIITGLSSEDKGVEAVKRGAEDYVEKGMVSQKMISYIIRSSIARASLKEKTYKALKTAEEAERSKSIFLSNMSHEIRTPLNLILGNTELLFETSLTDQQSRLIKSFASAGKHLLRVINDLLDLSSIENNHFKFEDCPIDLEAELSEVSAITKPICIQKGVAFNVHLDSKIPKTLICDPTRIKQVILNLLNNSIKFTKRGSVTLRTALVKSDDKSATVEFSVQDTGVGIEKNELQNIFTQFYQTNQGMQREYGGSGIGLSIAQTIVNHYNGRFDVDSSLGKGCHIKFQMILPYQKKSIQFDNINSSLRIMTVKKILIVDDDVDNRNLVSAFLNKTPYKLTFAQSGEHALDFIEKQNFDLVLMDVQMPQKDGFEVTKDIKRNKDHEGLRILGFSANAMPENIRKAREAGMSGYITKPIKKIKLIDAIESGSKEIEFYLGENL